MKHYKIPAAVQIYEANGNRTQRYERAIDSDGNAIVNKNGDHIAKPKGDMTYSFREFHIGVVLANRDKVHTAEDMFTAGEIIRSLRGTPEGELFSLEDDVAKKWADWTREGKYEPFLIAQVPEFLKIVMHPLEKKPVADKPKANGKHVSVEVVGAEHAGA